MSREAMKAAPRLRDGTIIPADAIVCTNRFTPQEKPRYVVRSRWLPGSTQVFDSRAEALAAILANDATVAK